MAKARVRIELKKGGEKSFEKLRRDFKTACKNYNIPALISEKTFFVRPCDKRRKKKQMKLLAIKLGKENGEESK